MEYNLDKLLDKKLSIVIMTSTLVKKLPNFLNSMHTGQRDLKLVLIKKYRSLG